MPSTPNQAKWTDEHDHVLLRAIVTSTLAARRAIYVTPGLEDVAGNGGSRINQRLQLMLRRMLEQFPKANTAGMVEEAVGKGSKARGPRTPRTPKSGAAGVKRERDANGDSEVDEDSEEEVETPSKKPKLSAKAKGKQKERVRGTMNVMVKTENGSDSDTGAYTHGAQGALVPFTSGSGPGPGPSSASGSKKNEDSCPSSNRSLARTGDGDWYEICD